MRRTAVVLAVPLLVAATGCAKTPAGSSGAAAPATTRPAAAAPAVATPTRAQATAAADPGRTELCARYADLNRALSALVMYGPQSAAPRVFEALGSLGDVARDYDADSGVRSDGQALSQMAGTSSTSAGLIMQYSMHIASECN